MTISENLTLFNEAIYFDGMTSLFYNMNFLQAPTVITELRLLGFHQRADLLEEIEAKFSHPIRPNAFKTRDEALAHGKRLGNLFHEFATNEKDWLDAIEKRYIAIEGENILK